MRRVLLRWAPAAVLATLAVGVVLLFLPVERGLALRVYLLVVAGLALATFAAATSYAARRRPSAFEAALHTRPARDVRPEELVRLETQVVLGLESAADFHYRLRPSLVAAAEAAVWRHHALPLERAERLFDAEVWELVRPGAEPPHDRRGPGPSLEVLERAVVAIERIRL